MKFYDIFTETMDRALRAANVSAAVGEVVTTNGDVSAALLPELRRLGNARLDGDVDFDAERFPNAEKYFHGNA